MWAVIIAIPVIIASCKKSDSPAAQPTKPTISTNAVTNITATSATSGGFIGDSSNLYRVRGRGVIYSSIVTNPDLSTTNTFQTYDFMNTISDWGSFPSSMTGLTPNTTYYVKAYVGYEVAGPGGTTIISSLLGELRTFKTLP